MNNLSIPLNIYIGDVINVFNKYLLNDTISDNNLNNNAHLSQFKVNIQKNQNITINGIKYTFLVRKHEAYDTTFYSLLQNNPPNKNTLPCIVGHIDNTTFIIDNITKHKACSFPSIDSHLTKRMVDIIKRILQKEEPHVKCIDLTDNATFPCTNTIHARISDMYILKYGYSFYESIGFKLKIKQYRRFIRADKKKLDSAIFSLTDFLNIVYQYKTKKWTTQYLKQNPLDIKDGIPFREAMHYLYDYHCELMADISEPYMRFYNLTYIYGQQYTMQLPL